MRLNSGNLEIWKRFFWKEDHLDVVKHNAAKIVFRTLAYMFKNVFATIEVKV